MLRRWRLPRSQSLETQLAYPVKSLPIVAIPLAPFPPDACGQGIVFTAGSGKAVRAVAKTTFKKYGQFYMGQKQHPIHVLRDMRRHPDRADRVIGESIVDFAAGVFFRLARDVLEDATPVAHTLLTIQEVFGQGRAFLGRGEDGRLHIKFRRLTKPEKVLFFIAALIPVFPINTIYDVLIGLFQLVWGVIKVIFGIISTPYALIRGPKNYDMKTGQVKSHAAPAEVA